MLKIATALLLSLALTGCGSLNLHETFENRVACSMDRTQGIFASWYGPIGIAAKVSEKDVAMLCQQPAVKVAP